MIWFITQETTRYQCFDMAIELYNQDKIRGYKDIRDRTLLKKVDGLGKTTHEYIENPEIWKAIKKLGEELDKLRKKVDDFSSSLETNLETTIISGVQGDGTPTYIPYWSQVHRLGDSPMYVSGSNIGLGTITPARKMEISVSGTGNTVTYALRLMRVIPASPYES